MLRTAALALSVCSLAAALPAAEPLELNKGDHICIIGNALAERMQHFGWLETLIQAKFPEHELVIRNLGYSGDEIDGWKNFNHRLRSMDYGSQDQWLAGDAPIPQPQKLGPRDQGQNPENRFEGTNTKADVIFAFYGYNESWAGEKGLPEFKKNVAEFIDHTLSQKYNGEWAPKLVLFGPTPVELTGDPNLPNRDQINAINQRLRQYTEAMREVAQAKNVLSSILFSRAAGRRRRVLESVLGSGVASSSGIPRNCRKLRLSAHRQAMPRWLSIPSK